MDRTLWYDSPARGWNGALPLGNGRVGAMVFGGVAEERIALNEDSLWYGGPRSRLNPDARANVGKIQELLFQCRIHEAEQLSMTALAGVPENPAHDVPLGDLGIDFRNHEGIPVRYRRQLDIENAACRVTYELDGVEFTREVIVSAPDQVLAVRLTAGRPGALSCAIRFTRERYAGDLSHPDDRTILMRSSGGRSG